MSSKNEHLKQRFQKLDDFDSEKEVIEHFKIVTMLAFLSQVQKELDRKKWTRKQLADEIGVSDSYVSQLFRGDKVINLETMVKISLALDRSFELTIPRGNFHPACG